MPSTPNFALPYSSLSDPPNGPDQIQALASQLDAVMQLRSVSSTGAVTSPYTNQFVYNSTDGLLYRYTGSGWVAVDSGKPACQVVMSSTKSIANSFDSDLQWDSAEENWTDPVSGNSMWAASPDPFVIIIRRAGLYRVGFTELYAANATGKRVATVTKNSTGTPTNASSLAYGKGNVTSGDVVPVHGSNLARLAVGDVLRLSTWQNSGGSLNVIGNTIEGKTRMSAEWIKP